MRALCQQKIWGSYVLINGRHLTERKRTIWMKCNRENFHRVRNMFLLDCCWYIKCFCRLVSLKRDVVVVFYESVLRQSFFFRYTRRMHGNRSTLLLQRRYEYANWSPYGKKELTVNVEHFYRKVWFRSLHVQSEAKNTSPLCSCLMRNFRQNISIFNNLLTWCQRT